MTSYREMLLKHLRKTGQLYNKEVQEWPRLMKCTRRICEEEVNVYQYRNSICPTCKHGSLVYIRKKGSLWFLSGQTLVKILRTEGRRCFVEHLEPSNNFDIGDKFWVKRNMLQPTRRVDKCHWNDEK